MNKGRAIFVVFMWSLWLLFGYLILFENSSLIYKYATSNGEGSLASLIVILLMWASILIFGTVAYLNPVAENAQLTQSQGEQ